MVSNAFQMQSFFRTEPLSVDTQAQKLFEDDDILDDDILNQTTIDSGLDMSPPVADTRRESFAPSSAFLSPKTEDWPVEMQALPSNNPFSSNNPFMQTQQQNFAASTPAWPMANPAASAPPAGLPTVATGPAPFDGLPSEFDQTAPLFHRAIPQTPFSNPGAQLPIFSPVAASNPALPASPANANKRMRPNSPPIRSHNELRRGDGIRKKNARFDIPAERTLSNIDQLISQSHDEQEIKELKQQKRLLRNRQAALDSRQRKKQHTERLEDEKKQFTSLVTDLEEEMHQLKSQMEHLIREKQSYEDYISNLNMEKEEMVRTHTIETGELRKKVSVLTEHITRLESTSMNSNDGFENNFSEMDGMAVDNSWNIDIFNEDFTMENDVKQELQVVPVKKQELTIPTDLEKPAAQGGLLFMLFLVGAFVLSNKGPAPQIPHVSEDVREASATLLNNIFKEAGVNQASAVVAMPPQPSGATVPTSWSAAPSAPVLGGLAGAGAAPSALGDLTDTLTQPTEDQANEQLFGLSASQYNNMNSANFLQAPSERTTSQGRRNLAEALAAMRSNSKQSTAEVYTRSLLWDQIPGDVVRSFAKMVADDQATTVDV